MVADLWYISKYAVGIFLIRMMIISLKYTNQTEFERR